jgi:sugar/nucleoside kinase (ribokinase family)
MSMVIVGSVAYDGLETPHGKVDRILGGSCTYVALAASYFCEARIVGVVGDDFAQEDYDFLASRKIDMAGLERAPGKTFFWAGRYSADMNDRETLTTDLNVFADFNPKLPKEWLSSEALFLGNIQPALQRAVREQMPKTRLVGGDTMNLWINIAKEELLKTIAGWDFLLINDGEARLLAEEQNLRRAGDKILAMGPHTAVIKRGEHGALLWREDGHFMVPGYLLEDVFDPTGAGDCFAGGFMGYLAGRNGSLEDPNEVRRAIIYGSVMGSFCCERFGPERFRTLTREEIDARFEEFRQFTSF